MEEKSPKVAQESTLQLSIWETMVLEERKLEAERRGIRVCDLEEETSLFQALEDSVPKNEQPQQGKSNKTAISEKNSAALLTARVSHLEPSLIGVNTVDGNHGKTTTGDDDDERNFDDEELKQQILVALSTSEKSAGEVKKKSPAARDIPAEVAIIQELSIWQLFLPQDLTNRILLFLGDVDMCGYLLQVAKTNCFKPNESIYKSLCEHIYTAQSKKKKLVVENWKSWRNMLVLRPRIRTNGFYCLRTLYSRAPSNDSFWEEKITQSIEVKFYRHMRFFDDGRMLYSLDTVEPDDMARHLTLGTVVPKKIFEGRYTLVGKTVHVEIEMHYAVVHFTLLILDGQDGYVGKHNTLRMIEHASAALFRGAPVVGYWGTEKVNHTLPQNTDLQFWRHWPWNSTNDVHGLAQGQGQGQ